MTVVPLVCSWLLDMIPLLQSTSRTLEGELEVEILFVIPQQVFSLFKYNDISKEHTRKKEMRQNAGDLRIILLPLIDFEC